MKQGADNKQPAKQFAGLPPTLARRLTEFCASRNVAFEDKPRFSAERVSVTLAGYAELHGGDDEAELFNDLLADLLHFADSRGFDFDDQLERARANYDAERE